MFALKLRVAKASSTLPGQKSLAVDQLSGTRKLASLSGAPASWYKNYRLYHAGLVVRIHQRRGKQGSQTIGGLVEVSRELSDPGLVCFTLLFEDIVSQALSPFHKNIQQSSLEPVLLFSYIGILQRGLAERRQMLDSLRRFVLILSLLTAYLPAKDLEAWCHANQYSRVGKIFPHLCRHAFEIVTKAEFQRCKLQIIQDISPTALCVHPRCQCPGQTQWKHKVRCKMKIGGRDRHLLVPEWVRRSPVTGPLDAAALYLPRFRFVPMEERTPVALQQRSRFIRSANMYRCIASKSLGWAFIQLFGSVFRFAHHKRCPFCRYKIIDLCEMVGRSGNVKLRHIPFVMNSFDVAAGA